MSEVKHLSFLNNDWRMTITSPLKLWTSLSSGQHRQSASSTSSDWSEASTPGRTIQRNALSLQFVMPFPAAYSLKQRSLPLALEAFSFPPTLCKLCTFRCSTHSLVFGKLLPKQGCKDNMCQDILAGYWRKFRRAWNAQMQKATKFERNMTSLWSPPEDTAFALSPESVDEWSIQNHERLWSQRSTYLRVHKSSISLNFFCLWSVLVTRIVFF